MSVVQEVPKRVKLPPCPQPNCRSTTYVLDDATGVPMYCAQCSMNATHIPQEIIDQCRAVAKLLGEKKEQIGIPPCPGCNQHGWLIDDRSEGGPYAVQCLTCGRNWPYEQDPELILTVHAAQQGIEVEEARKQVVKMGESPVDPDLHPTLPVAIAVRNPADGEPFVVPDENIINHKEREKALKEAEAGPEPLEPTIISSKARELREEAEQKAREQEEAIAKAKAAEQEREEELNRKKVQDAEREKAAREEIEKNRQARKEAETQEEEEPDGEEESEPEVLPGDGEDDLLG